MTTIVDYRSLPPEVQAHIAQIEDFIGDMENAELIDGSTVYAEDVVEALNGIIAALGHQQCTQTEKP